jgi:hypothetical protein
MLTKTKLIAVMAAATALTIPAMAAAQDTSLRSNYGEITLNAGFTPDPHVVNVTAGGNLEASRVSSNCRGSVSNAPDYQVTYRAGSLPLIFRARSSSDTTLVINGADGRWYCDDDSGGNRNPQVIFDNPSSGVYDVWVGTYSGGTASAQLEVSELRSGGSVGGGGGGGLDPSLEANYGSINLRAGFTPDPYTIGVTSGGGVDASSVGNGCRGMVARAPDFQLTYEAGRFPLTISTYSNSDTTLVINDPNGRWTCDDDGGDDLNARVRWSNPPSGVYDIWVGAYSGGNAPTTLEISERR